MLSKNNAYSNRTVLGGKVQTQAQVWAANILTFAILVTKKCKFKNKDVKIGCVCLCVCAVESSGH